MRLIREAASVAADQGGEHELEDGLLAQDEGVTM